ncbi:hypothetical protein BD779DRAFT_1469257 [Infundibulicybe gibba]|nr:hypothetical protein BD779DRAFT_1469257 [Infundibulicybe gibba]
MAWIRKGSKVDSAMATIRCPLCTGRMRRVKAVRVFCTCAIRFSRAATSGSKYTLILELVGRGGGSPQFRRTCRKQINRNADGWPLWKLRKLEGGQDIMGGVEMIWWQPRAICMSPVEGCVHTKRTTRPAGDDRLKPNRFSCWCMAELGVSRYKETGGHSREVSGSDYSEASTRSSCGLQMPAMPWDHYAGLAKWGTETIIGLNGSKALRQPEEPRSDVGYQVDKENINPGGSGLAKGNF